MSREMIRRECVRCRVRRRTTTTRSPYICGNCSVFLAEGYVRLRNQATKVAIVTGIVAFVAGFALASVV